ncbi:MAG: sugar nucleotide-binding protein, partial [bacterium]
YIVNDKMGTPTYTHDFAKNVKLLLENEFWGLYNMVCDGLTSRLEVAQELLSLLNLEGKVKIIEVPSDYFRKDFFAPRPDSERLINKKLDLRGLNRMRDWRIALKEYLEDYYRSYI